MGIFQDSRSNLKPFELFRVNNSETQKRVSLEYKKRNILKNAIRDRVKLDSATFHGLPSKKL